MKLCQPWTTDVNQHIFWTIPFFKHCSLEAVAGCLFFICESFFIDISRRRVQLTWWLLLVYVFLYMRLGRGPNSSEGKASPSKAPLLPLLNQRQLATGWRLSFHVQPSRLTSNDFSWKRQTTVAGKHPDPWTITSFQTRHLNCCSQCHECI